MYHDHLPIHTGLLRDAPIAVSAVGWTKLSSQGKCSIPSLNLFPLVNVFPAVNNPKWNAVLQMRSNKHWERIIMSLVFWWSLYSHSQGCCGSSICTVQRWPVLSSLPARVPKFLSTELPLLLPFLSLYCSEDFSFQFFLVGLLKSGLALCSSLSVCLWM